jgi:hypothetical protein
MTSKTLPQLILGATLAFALATSAFAQGANAGAKGAMTDGDVPINYKGMPSGFKNKMTSLDTDKDGMISKAEFLSYAGAMFDKMDSEHKGMMTPKQYMAFAKAMSSDVVGKTHE